MNPDCHGCGQGVVLGMCMGLCRPGVDIDTDQAMADLQRVRDALERLVRANS